MKQVFYIRSIMSALLLLLIASIALFAFYIHNGTSIFTYASLQSFQASTYLTLRVDTLSTLMFMMISFLGLSVGHYSLRYLDGDSRQIYFFSYLLIIVLAASMLVLSGNLAVFFLSWLGISVALHRLLLYHSTRPAAVRAARKKMLLSRLGDVCLLFGIGLIYKVTHSLDFETIFNFLGNEGQRSGTPQNDGLMTAATICFVLGALIKSAQFPLHFWLPDTMEAPTPVSALMHAGVINAGGILLIRLSPILEYHAAANLILTVMGALTAVYGSLVMVTQNNIKKKLAYSTISQMGLMIFTCGVGAYSLAIFHIVAHSIYKAHAFMSTGYLVEQRIKHSFEPKAIGFAPFWGIVSAASLLVILGASWRTGEFFPYCLYISICLLGFSQTLINFKLPAQPLTRASALAIGSTLSLALLLCLLFELLLSIEFEHKDRINVGMTLSSNALFAGILGFLIFVGGFWLSQKLLQPSSSFAQRLYMRLWNDSYLSLKSTALLGYLWPAHSRSIR
ncbi:MAG: hypothetical protein H7249_20425 [Chitinophagaceae bacterium]|nr:hypothetical protein [Oligoflexus sp.]